MASKLLTERSILSALKKSAVEGKPCTIKDDEGSTLIARPDGAGWWRLRYWLDSKENRLSLSTFPETGLRQARDKRDAARRLIGTGADPSKLRKAEKAERAQQRVARALADAGLPGRPRHL